MLRAGRMAQAGWPCTAGGYGCGNVQRQEG